MSSAVKNNFSLSRAQWCRLHLCLLLLAAVIMSPAAGSLCALLLLGLNVCFLFRVPPAPWPLLAAELNWYLLAVLAAPAAVSLAGLWQAPLLLVQVLAVVILAPLLYLIDLGLRDYAATAPLVFRKTGRRLSPVARVLFTAVLVMLLLAPVLDSIVLLLAALLQLVYLTVMTLLSLLRARTASLETSGQQRRMVAGRTAAVSIRLSCAAAAKWYCRLFPADATVSIAKPCFTLNGAPWEVSVTVKPGLAGPARPEIAVALGDARGLLRIDRVIRPLELHVIPRARYARWLAEKYLARTEVNPAVTVPVPLPVAAVTYGGRGLEYRDSREYYPGDPLRDIDWKHTVKLGRLIVKQYAPETGRLAVIAVNLSAADAEAADRLTYDLVTTALTLVEERIPAALTAYDREEVRLTVGVSDPREILKQTLRLVRDIRLEPDISSRLQPPEPARLRRDIARLKRVKTTPAARLREMLELEYRAVEGAAREHPATRALLRLAQDITPPAALIQVSARTHDGTALAIADDRLRHRGYNIVSQSDNA